MPLLVIVIHVSLGVGHKGAGGVIRVDAENLGEKRIGIAAFLRGRVQGLGLVGGQRLVLGHVLVGKAAVLKIADELAAEVKALQVGNGEVEAQHAGPGRQAVAEAVKCLIRAVLDVASRAQHRQKYGGAEVVGLLVGGYFDFVVVGQHEADLNPLDLAEIVDGVFDARGEVFDVVGQGDDIRAAGHNRATAANAALDHWDDVAGVLDAIDENAPPR